MNIFVLDKDPAKAAESQCDKHVVKMVLETAQMLCTAFEAAPYKRTHVNHPCSKWARASRGNYLWLIAHGKALSAEYTLRYGKIHKSSSVIDWCDSNSSLVIFPQTAATEHVCCMPEEYKIPGDVVASYRAYYKGDKASFAKWTGRIPPAWWLDKPCGGG